MPMDHDDRETAERLLDKVREFAASLDDEERALFAALIAPGVTQAYAETDAEADDEVVGFGEVPWSPRALPDALAREVREQGVRVERLTD